MIWRMDPFLMPKSFCIGKYYLNVATAPCAHPLIAQTVLMGFSTFLLTGVSTAFSLATSLCVSKPKAWGDNGKGCVPFHTVPVPLLTTWLHLFKRFTVAHSLSLSYCGIPIARFNDSDSGGPQITCSSTV